MTIEQAKKEIPNYEVLEGMICNACSCEGICPTRCEALENGSKIPYEIILERYAKTDGDLNKVLITLKHRRLEKTTTYKWRKNNEKSK